MNPNFSILRKADISYLDSVLFDQNGNLRILFASEYAAIKHDHLRLWCHARGIYGLPTIELLTWLKMFVIPEKTIEIGAGNGAIGRTLGIPITDSCLMRNQKVAAYYEAMGQPITTYPDDIIKLDAVVAVKSFKPDVVIGCWVTHKFKPGERWRGGNKWGIDEEQIINRVKTYIVIGHADIHRDKPIMDSPHKTFAFPWLWSRGEDHGKDRIFVWQRN